MYLNETTIEKIQALFAQNPELAAHVRQSASAEEAHACIATAAPCMNTGNHS